MFARCLFSAENQNIHRMGLGAKKRNIIYYDVPNLSNRTNARFVSIFRLFDFETLLYFRPCCVFRIILRPNFVYELNV